MPNLTIDQNKPEILSRISSLVSQTNSFRQERDVALAKVATLEKQVAELEKKLFECQSNVTVTQPDMDKWEINGLSLSTTESGVTTSINYKLKE